MAKRNLLKNDRAHPLVAVFGSSRAKTGDRLYANSIKMGRLLGEAGFTLMTGGYSGVMAAVSRGAYEAGAKVIGVTLARFEERPNHYVAEEIRTTTFYERFRWLIDRPDSFVAMDGGIGTLTEVAFAWQALYVGMIPARPLVLVGPRWRRIIATFRANSINPDRVFDSLSIVATPEQALAMLLAHFSVPISNSVK